MKGFVEYVVKALVERPDEVGVTQREAPGGALLEINCDRCDMGKVIGRGGRTIKAMRALLDAAAARSNLRVELEIID
jgi:predicted RNA-binding protein YlqC (UPF0109 family)